MLRKSFQLLSRQSNTSFKSTIRPAAVTNFHTCTISRKEEESEEVVAKKLIESVPGPDKTYNLLLGTLATTALLSKEIIPYTADIVYVVPFGITAALAFKHVGPLLSETADKIVQEKDKFWGESKAKAEERLEEQITEITGSGITDLVQVTEDLFDHAEELTNLEAKAYEHEQSVVFHTKAKQILDEWVRYENNEREREQKLIAEAVIAQVSAAVKDASFQQKYLEQCFQDIQTSLAR